MILDPRDPWQLLAGLGFIASAAFLIGKEATSGLEGILGPRPLAFLVAIKPHRGVQVHIMADHATGEFIWSVQVEGKVDATGENFSSFAAAFSDATSVVDQLIAEGEL